MWGKRDIIDCIFKQTDSNCFEIYMVSFINKGQVCVTLTFDNALQDIFVTFAFCNSCFSVSISILSPSLSLSPSLCHLSKCVCMCVCVYYVYLQFLVIWYFLHLFNQPVCLSACLAGYLLISDIFIPAQFFCLFLFIYIPATGWNDFRLFRPKHSHFSIAINVVHLTYQQLDLVG